MNNFFKETIKGKFDFLETSYGFKCKRLDNHSAQFFNNNVSICVFYELSSYEIYVIFELKCDNELLQVKIHEVAQIHEPFSFLCRSYYAKNNDLIESYLCESKKVMVAHCRKLIYGDKEEYVSYIMKREQKKIAKLEEINKKNFKKKFDIYWKEKEFRSIIKLCESEELKLSKSQLMKLEYSKIRLEENDSGAKDPSDLR